MEGKKRDQSKKKYPEMNGHARKEGRPENGDAADFSMAMKAAGHGKFQYGVFVSAVVIYFASGLQSAINGYILPSVKCEFTLSPSQLGMLNSAYLAGGVLTGQVWGALSDAVGRRPVLVGSVLLDSVFTLGAVLSPSFSVFFAFRVLSGMMNTAPAGLSYLYLGEFITEKKRSPFMFVLGATWTSSWTCLPAVAWLVIPQPWSVWLLGLRLGSWKLFLAMLLVPNLISVALAFYYPETPMYLHSTGQEEAALAVYRRIFTVNTGRCAEDYPVKQLRISASAHSAASNKSVMHHLSTTLKNCVNLLKPPVLSRTLLCCVLYFCNMFMMYGFGFWLPEILNIVQLYGANHPDFDATICEVMKDLETEKTDTKLDAEDCVSDSIINPTVFLYTLIVNSGSVLLNIITSFTTKCIGRRTMCVVFFTAAGIAGSGLLFASTTLQLVAVCTMFVGLGETACIAFNALIVDIFPPRYSGAGVSTVMLSGRLGGAVANVIIGYLLEVSCEVPLILFCAVGILSGLLSCCAHRPYVEANEDDNLKTNSPAA